MNESAKAAAQGVWAGVTAQRGQEPPARHRPCRAHEEAGARIPRKAKTTELDLTEGSR